MPNDCSQNPYRNLIARDLQNRPANDAANGQALVYWASGLEPAYLEGAFPRAQSL